MKKLLFILMGSAMILGCSQVKEAPPSEQSIETVNTVGGDKVLIRLKPKVGDTQKTIMTMEMNAEGAQAISMNMNANMDIKVMGKEGSVYDYELKYNSIKMDMDAGGMEMSYDSSSPEQSGMGAIMHEQMKPFFDNPMSMKMDERGNISEFKLPGNMSSQQMGDMGSMSIPMPEEPVGVGDSWTAERPVEGTGTMKMNMKVEKITVDDLVIGTTGDMLDTSGLKIGSFNGSYKLDRNSGLTKDGTMNMSLDVQGQPMKMKINFKTL